MTPWGTGIYLSPEQTGREAAPAENGAKISEREARIRDYLKTTQDDPFYTGDLTYLIAILDAERLLITKLKNMTISITKFWEVMWRHNGRPEGTYHPDNPVGVKESIWYVSDPFADKDAAQRYADWRAKQDCDAEVWEVEKTKQKIGVGHE